MEDKTIWGIHAGKTGDAEYLFLKKNVIAIGWEEFGSFEGLNTRDEFKEKYAEVYPNSSINSIRTSAGQLFRFTHKVNIGEFVAFPAKSERQIHIGEITSDYVYKPNIDKNYPNQRSVKWIKKVPRTSFSQAALYEMGSAMSFFQIQNYADEIYAILEGEPISKSLDEESTSFVLEDLEQQTKDFIIKQLERNLKGLLFEEFAKHVLENMGYRVRFTHPNEPSVDLIAHKDELGFEPPIIRVQVKSGTGNISDRDVSALFGKVGNQEFGLLITLGGFTPPARRFAYEKTNLRLIDGEELVDMILEHYEEFAPKYKGIIPLKMVYLPQTIDKDKN